ncbi:hypothetical protein AVEN_135053-1 [Araneus ventricosus]|uniref:Uncharacterized protein n=1 Tax=Araneus ventricosus TaxID=182803 RepID=A0A4Y2CY63_ARAVE|nr:hypothetical protein AVEN_135053-1 [Araneus ventricosus]
MREIGIEPARLSSYTYPIAYVCAYKTSLDMIRLALSLSTVTRTVYETFVSTEHKDVLQKTKSCRFFGGHKGIFSSRWDVFKCSSSFFATFSDPARSNLQSKTSFKELPKTFPPPPLAANID